MTIKLLEHRIGDVFASSVDGVKIIPHIVNDIGGWGSGFVVAVSKHWSKPEQAYHSWFNTGTTKQMGQDVPFILGNTQFVRVETNIIIANMIGQHKMIKAGYKPIRYASLIRCMESVLNVAHQIKQKTKSNVEIHAPKFGSGLAGGNWTLIEELIKEIWVANGLKTVIFSLE